MVIHLIGRVVLVLPMILVGGQMLLVSGVFGAEPALVPAGEADDLVRAALAAELTGDSPRRDRLLHEVLRVCPDHAAARGILGMVRGEDGWRTVDDLIDANRQDERLARYEELRTRLGDSPEGHLQLARYCTRHDMPVRARFHWYGVLNARPDHTAAMRALGLKRFRGALLTEEQIEQVVEQEDLVERWRPRFERWAESIRDREDGWEEALGKLRETRDPRLIGLLASSISPTSETCAAEVVRILSLVDTRDSDYLLVLHAVDSPHPSVRTAAIDALRDRSIFRVVPLLMGELGTHVGYTFRFALVSCPIPGGPLSWAAVQRDVERPEGLYVQRDTWTLSTSTRRPTRGMMKIFARLHAERENVAESNENIDARNRKTIVALTATTGRELGENPREWWSWWLEFNDYQYDPPTYETYTYQIIQVKSCFAAGTAVTTDLGPKPIEQLRVGDRVLTRNVETGEAEFELVARTTRRQASKMLRIRLDAEELLTTSGHPFWVVGRGWRMARELQPGDRLHCLVGSQEIRDVREASPQTVYNLIVGADAQRRNYFVGQGRVLAHDATLREPTDRPLPGCSPLESANAR